MRFFTERRKFYCGSDLHGKKMFVCIVNDAGEIVLHRNLPTEADSLKRALAPFLDGLVVGVATNLRSVPDVFLVLGR